MIKEVHEENFSKPKDRLKEPIEWLTEWMKIDIYQDKSL